MNPQETLKLEYIVPYLLYDLKMTKEDWGKTGTLVPWIMTLKDGLQIELDYAITTQAKPILRPLIDMYKIEEIMDEFSDQSRENFELSFFTDLGRCGNCFDFVNYTLMQLFFKHHIDIFGLIEKGLAIDFNQLKLTDN